MVLFQIRVHLIHFLRNFSISGSLIWSLKKDSFSPNAWSIRFATPKLHFLNQELKKTKTKTKKIIEREITGGRSGGLGAGGGISGGITALGQAKPLRRVDIEVLKQFLVAQEIAKACCLLHRRISQRPATSLRRRRRRVKVACAWYQIRRASWHVLGDRWCSDQGGDRDEES